MSPSTSDLLIGKYSPVISQAELAEIFGQHVQTIRRLGRTGRLPFPNVSISCAEKRYRLSDVLEYLENPPSLKTKRGRPVGSKNRIEAISSHAPQ